MVPAARACSGAMYRGVPISTPVCVWRTFVGDGSFLYNPVIQALGASKTYNIPILIVVCNNAK